MQRRDLTINAIAQDQDGTLIDPCDGQADLANKVFRHISDAFTEDPVRILRVARFAARFTEFVVAPQTAELMHHMVESGEVDALVSERVWQEISRGLMEAKPSRMFGVLRECRALTRLMPELDSLATQSSAASFEKTMRELDNAAQLEATLPVRFAVITHNLPSEQLASELCDRLKLPSEVKELALLAARERDLISKADAIPAADIVKLLERCDAFRKADRFKDLLKVHKLIHQLNHNNNNFLSVGVLEASLQVAKAINAGQIAASVAANNPDNPTQPIASAVHDARVNAVQAVLNSQPK